MPRDLHMGDIPRDATVLSVFVDLRTAVPSASKKDLEVGP
jgi:hypothetical protein